MAIKRFPARGYKTVYAQTFDASGTGSWTASANVTGLSRVTTTGSGFPSADTNALTWTATAAGDTNIQSPFITISPSSDLLMTGRIALGGTGTFSVRVNMDWWNGGSYVNGIYDWTRAGIVADGTFRWLFGGAVIPTGVNQLTMGITVFAATAGQAIYVDNVTVYS